MDTPPKPGFRFPLPKIPVKNLLFIAVIIIIPAILLLLSFKLDLKNPLASKTEPKLIKQGNVADLGPQLIGHPQLFYADLEYNPKTNTVILIKTGNTSGDIPQLLDNEPASSSARLTLKIETISQDNKMLHFGWMSVLKEAKQTPSNTYKFQITTVYQPKAKITVYLEGRGLVWSTKMP